HVALSSALGHDSRGSTIETKGPFLVQELFYEDTWSARSTSSPVRDRCEPAEISLERILQATEKKKSQDRERRKEVENPNS
ncbi:hypothetical protein K0M31_001865, partial [Melipona bicolor]